MYCEKCGTYNVNEAKFCAKCGSVLPNDAANKTAGGGSNNPSINQGGIRNNNNQGNQNNNQSNNVVLFILIAIIIALVVGIAVYFLTKSSNNSDDGGDAVSEADTVQLQTDTPQPTIDPSADIDEQIKGVRKLIAEGDYISADLNITELYSKDLTDEQREEVDIMKQTIDTAQLQTPEVQYVTAAPSSNTSVIATYYVVNCRESITLRAAPSTSAAEIVQIPLGAPVGYIENAGNGFYKINYNGRVGYSLAAYLSASKQDAIRDQQPPAGSNTRTARVVNANEYITLRSTPSTSASEVTKIPAGAYVTYLGRESGDFYYIEYNGMRGYGLKSYLQLQ